MINYNSELKSADHFSISPTNRAFAYADAVFETILFHSNQFPLLLYHYQRLNEASGIMQWQNPFPSLADFENELWRLLHHEQSLTKKSLRIKVFVWRKEGGLYTPTSSEANFLITVENIDLAISVPEKSAIISKTIKLNNHMFSALKRTACTEYILGGIELRNSDAAEIIFCDQQGNMAEALSSNLYCKKGNTIITPPLTSGCVNGSSRRMLMDRIEESGYMLKEKTFSPDLIESGEMIFTANALGVSLISPIEGLERQKNLTFLQKIRNQFWLY